MNQSIKELFSFTKAERRGIFLLLLIIFILLIYDVFTPSYNVFLSENQKFELEVEKFLASKKEKKKKPIGYLKKEKKSSYKRTTPTRLTPHSFDPNMMTKKQWIAMGLSERQANTIEKYKAKGGFFRKAEDLQKIYCISQNEYEQLSPYIIINDFEVHEFQQDIAIDQLDLNLVNIDQIQCVKGIGPAYAKRIIKYRQLLGGYVHIDQLKEVYGMDASRYQQISPYFSISMDSIRILSLNKTSYSQLKWHPYISKDLAYEIIDYRKMHGDFKSVEDLKKISLMNDSLYQKIYLYFAAY